MKKLTTVALALCVASIAWAGLNKEIVDRVKAATVFILMKSNNNLSVRNPEGSGMCSGFVINEKRHIVTNYHCIHNADELKLAFYDKDDWNIYKVEIIGKDPLSDLAVIHIPKRKKPLPYLEWSEEELWDGMDVFAVGHPFGMVWSVSKGIVSNTERIIRSPYVRLLQTDVAINHGNSGGPLVNTAGKVIGVNAMIINPSPIQPKTNIGMALSIRKDDAREIVDVIKEGKEFVRAYIGVRLVNLNPLNLDTVREMPEVKEANITVPDIFGCMIAPLGEMPEGLQYFDIIIGVDGNAVNRQEDLTNVVRKKKVGETINLLIVRDKLNKNVKVTLRKLEIRAGELYDKQGKLQPPGKSR